MTRLIVLGFALFATMLLSLGIGAYPMSLAAIAKILWSIVVPFARAGGWTATEHAVIEIVRLPRILVATLAGAGLGVSGAVLQGLMRNPLIGPDLVGVTSGASVGGIIAILIGAGSAGIVAAAFCGGSIALVAAFALARLARAAGVFALVLAGVIVSAFLSAMVGLIESFADPRTQLPDIVYWTLGSFANATWRDVAIIGVPTAFGATILFALRWRLNLLSLAEEDAAALGVPVRILRWSIVAIVALIAAAQVSVSGGVGWVGLVIPHLARMIVGPDYRRLLPASALLGGAFLLAVDDVARSGAGGEIPIGVLTALIGTPAFAFLFWRTQARGWSHE